MADPSLPGNPLDPTNRAAPRSGAVGWTSGDAWAVGALAALWGWCFRALIAGRGLVFDGEIHEILLPLHQFLREQVIEHGRVPLWNPHFFFGYPWVGAIQAGPLYPPSSMLDLVLPAPVALSWNVALHFALAAAAMYAFARMGLAVRPAAAAAAAAVYAFNGHMLGNLGQLHNHATLAWVPLVLLAIRRIVAARSWGSARRAVALGSIALALSWLGGMAQQALYVSVLEVLYAVALLRERARSSPTPGAWADPAARLLAMGLLACAMFAPQAWATASLLAESARSDVTARQALEVMAGSLSWADLLGFLFPNLVGWGELNALNTTFVGAIPVALALAWAWRSIRRGDVDERVFSAAAVCALVFAAGEHSPFTRWLYRLPLVGLFHDPSRAVSVALLAIAALSARAVDRLDDGERAARDVVRIGLAVTVVIVGGLSFAYPLGWLAPHESVGEGYATEIEGASRVTLQIVALVVLAAALLLVVRAIASSRARRATPALFASAILGMLGWLAVPFVRTESRETVKRFLRGPELLAHVPRALAAPGYPRLANLDRDDVAVEPFENEFRWASPTGFSSLVPREVLAFSGAGKTPNPLALTSPLDFTRIPHLLDLSASRFLLARRPFGERGEPIASGGGFFLYSNPSALPRAYRTRAACRPEPRTALDAVVAGTLDPRAITILDGGAPLDLGECDALAPRTESGAMELPEAGARFEVDEPDRLRIDVSAVGEDHPWLVILDRFAAGWRATADGRPIPLFRANALFRAVRVPPGAHAIELRYAPAGQRAFLGLALAAFAASLTLALAPRSRTRARGA